MMLRLLDYKWSEIGDALRQRPGTARERFRVALKYLRERLSDRSAETNEEDDEARELF